jgi:hypothetical protein
MADVDPKIVEAKRKAEESLLKLPGVTGVDIGYKEVGGKPTDQIAIRVLVEEKKDVPKAQRVPDQIEGFATDVIQRKFELHQFSNRMPEADLHPMVDAGTYTPLKGGISIGPCRAIGGFVFAGTLGCLVKDNGTGKHMMLSNFHVMCVDNTHAVGDTMTQPSRVDGGACPAGIVGTLARQSLGGKVDCAVADITGTRGDSCEIVDIGYVAGQAAAALGMAVRKRGRTTMLTYGVVDSIHLTVTIDYEDGLGNVTLTDQIGIKPDTAKNSKFGDHGDSGSVVVDNSRNVVGLYFAGDPTGYGVANPIADVLAALNVSLCIGGIKIKEIKDHLKDFKFEKIEHKEHKFEKFEHKDFKFELKEKLELKEIAKLEHPEKDIREKGGKELVEGGPEIPGGPGDPGPILGGPGFVGQAGDKLTDIAKPPKELKEFKNEKLEQKELKAEGKDIKSEKPEAKDLKEGKFEKPEGKDHKEGKIEKREDKPETKNELKDHKLETKEFKDHKHEKPEHKNELKDHKHEKPEIKELKHEKNELKDHKHEKPEHKNELKEHKHEKPEIKELKLEKVEKLENKEIGKLEQPEKPDFKEKDGKELKEGGFEGPGPGGPGDPGPILGPSAAMAGGAKLTELKAPKEIKDFKAEKTEKIEIKEFHPDKTDNKEFKDKELKYEKDEIKEFKPEKFEKNELKELKHEKPEHKNELKEHKREKFEHKEIFKEVSKIEFEKNPPEAKDRKDSLEKSPLWDKPDKEHDGPLNPGDPGPVIGQRLTALEQAVASLGHFISAGQRPDLSRGALSSEPDLAGQSATLAAQAKAAKDAKDAKDAEKLSDR